MRLTKIKILGKVYDVREEKTLQVDEEGKPTSKGRGLLPDRVGECDPPTAKNKSLTILEDLKGQHRLEILIHEFLHAADWDKEEVWVTQAGKDMARFLWKLGYRQTLPPKL